MGNNCIHSSDNQVNHTRDFVPAKVPGTGVNYKITDNIPEFFYPITAPS
jgi:hypothetical protein